MNALVFILLTINPACFDVSGVDRLHPAHDQPRLRRSFKIRPLSGPRG
jgi:hypothetical protein